MPVTMPTRPTLPKRESTKVPRSQTERLWLIGGGLIAFVLLLVGYFFFISPQRSQTSAVDSQVATAQQQNAQLQARLNALRQQNKNLPKYQADLAQARLALPATTGVPDFLRSLQALGNATNTTVTSATFSQPAAATPAAAPTASTDATASASPTDATGSDTTASGAVGSQPASAVSSVYSISIGATVSGSTANLDNFLEQLQVVQPRAVLITQISESSASVAAGGPASGGTTLQLTMQAFVSPAAQPAVASATPSQSAPSN
jgi:cell division protein FtsB